MMDVDLSKLACARADLGGSWVLEHIMELPQTADEQISFDANSSLGQVQLVLH